MNVLHIFNTNKIKLMKIFFPDNEYDVNRTDIDGYFDIFKYSIMD